MCRQTIFLASAWPMYYPQILPPTSPQRWPKQQLPANLSPSSISCQSGRAPWYEARIVPIRDHNQLVCLVRNVTEIHQARMQLEAVAHYDSLTGLANRSMLDNLLERSIRTARRNRKRLAIMFIDLDRFKEVNDTLGHAAGDELLQQAAMDHMALVEALLAALDRDSLTQVYHPQIDFVSGKPVGFEALARWTMPDSSSIPPIRFISLAEQAGLARRLDIWSLRTACCQLRQWLDEGLTPGQVSINLSTHSLNDGNFPEELEQVLAECQLLPHMLQIEIKELALLNSGPGALERLRAIIELGAEIAVDDFGAGYAALQYLRKLPVSTLKIDPAFMQRVPADKEQTIIADTVIAMGRALGLKVVAKGIESAARADFIRRHGDVLGQGFYFSQPLAGDELGPLLQSSPLLES